MFLFKWIGFRPQIALEDDMEMYPLPHIKRISLLWASDRLA